MEQFLIFLKMKKINADTLLEGMFGQTAGIGETKISSLKNTDINNKQVKFSENKNVNKIKLLK